MDWLPEAMRILRDELPNIEVTVLSQYSPDLAAALMRGKLDLAFLRPEPNVVDLTYKTLIKEPFVLVMPSDHRLASHEAICVREIVGETFIGVSNAAPVTRAVIAEYLRRSDIDITPAHEADHMAMAMSLVASTRGLMLLPACAQNFMPRSVVSRPLEGEPPTVDLVIGYSNANTSPILKMFLSKSDELISRFAKKVRTEVSVPG